MEYRESFVDFSLRSSKFITRGASEKGELAKQRMQLQALMESGCPNVWEDDIYVEPYINGNPQAFEKSVLKTVTDWSVHIGFTLVSIAACVEKEDRRLFQISLKRQSGEEGYVGIIFEKEKAFIKVRKPIPA